MRTAGLGFRITVHIIGVATVVLKHTHTHTLSGQINLIIYIIYINIQHFGSIKPGFETFGLNKRRVIQGNLSCVLIVETSMEIMNCAVSDAYELTQWFPWGLRQVVCVTFSSYLSVGV